MFGAKKWAILTEKLIKDWDNLENRINLEEIKALTRYSKSDDWYSKQINNLNSFKNRIEKIANEEYKNIIKNSNSAVDSALTLVDSSLKSTLKDKPDDETPMAIYYEKLDEFNNGIINGVVNVANTRHQFLVNQINFRTNANLVKEYTVGKDEVMKMLDGNIRPLKTVEETILDMIGEEKDQFNINVKYKNGRQVSLRTYLEMNLKTTLQQIATDKLKNSTDKLGIIFFIASAHADCADDHIDYQGKIYVKEDWQRYIKPERIDEIQSFINKNNIATMEWVISKPVYFTTRPNCRHYFRPITIEQALNKSLNELHKELNTKKPKTSESKEITAKRYNALKEQRKNERAIRKYKEKLLRLEQFKKNTGSMETDSFITATKAKIADYQAKQRALLQENKGILVRDYGREQIGFEKAAKIQENLTKPIEDVKIELTQEDEREVNLVVSNQITIAKELEKIITPTLQKIENKTHTKLVGLDHRLKKDESLKRKILNDYIEEHGKIETIDKTKLLEITKKIYDNVRYTFQLSQNNFYKEHKTIEQELLAQGIKIVRRKNTMANENAPYRGINSLYSYKGKIFEVQFHTAESFKIKQDNHIFYERQRVEQDLEIKMILNNFMKASYIRENFKTPNGAEKVKDVKMED